jgi:hypothetical protein
MTNLEGMPAYFWLTSSRLREPIRDEVTVFGLKLVSLGRKVLNS